MKGVSFNLIKVDYGFKLTGRCVCLYAEGFRDPQGCDRGTADLFPISLAEHFDMAEHTGGSLADRLTQADGSKFESPKAAPEESKTTGEPSSWADEEPVSALPAPQEGNNPSDSTQPEKSSLEQAQLDGATEWQAGSSNLLNEPSYDVNIKLSDVQADPNNPLYSLKRFEDLGV